MTSQDLVSLRRWEDFGGVWEVLESTTDRVTLSLRRCDGGEEVGRLVSTDPAVVDYVRRREPSP